MHSALIPRKAISANDMGGAGSSFSSVKFVTYGSFKIKMKMHHKSRHSNCFLGTLPHGNRITFRCLHAVRYPIGV